jgi:hypothetical protein
MKWCGFSMLNLISFEVVVSPQPAVSESNLSLYDEL